MIKIERCVGCGAEAKISENTFLKHFDPNLISVIIKCDGCGRYLMRYFDTKVDPRDRELATVQEWNSISKS